MEPLSTTSCTRCKLPRIPFLRLAAAASLVAIAAAFAPGTPRDVTPPPDLCALATRLNEAPLTEVCGAVRYLGNGTFAGVGLIPTGWTVLPAISSSAEGRDELAGARHFFEYDRFVVTVRSDSVQHLDMVLRTAAALNRIRQSGATAYQFLASTMVYPTAPSMADTLWKRRFARIIISFDKTPQQIAASATVEGRYNQTGAMRFYDDYSLVSIDEVTIRGETQQSGSRPIYGLPTPAENYRAYMADGLIYSIVHESSHRYVDHLRGTDRLANSIYYARFTDGTNAEEVVTNETGISLVGHMLSAPMHQHVMQLNTGFVGSAAARTWLSRWDALSARSQSHLAIPDVSLAP